jgi:hypothetical protein
MHITYGWPATATTYAIEFWDIDRQITTVVQPAYTDSNILYASDTQGLLLVHPLSGSNRLKPYTFPINDPPSLSSIRWMVRAALNDTETETGVDLKYPEAPKWPDTELDAYIREAIGLFNAYTQREVIIETKPELLREEALKRLSEVTSVSYYDDVAREWIVIGRFVRRSTRPPSQHWDIVNGHLRLYGQYPKDLRLEISALAPYPVPQNDQSPLLIDREDWDILSIYTQGRAYQRLAGQSAQLDRWKEEGKRNDNPVTPIARMLLDQADRRIKDRRGPRPARRYRT